MRFKSVFALFAFMLGAAQAAPPEADRIVDAVVEHLDKGYVFPAMGPGG